MKLLTFGYGGDKAPNLRLFPALSEHDCRLVIDVRDSPRSHKRPDWSARLLHASCKYLGVKYLHVPSLGNEPKFLDGKRRRVIPWNRPATWRYGMRTLLGALAIADTVLIMCCEGEPFLRGLPELGHYCHRVEIAHIALAEVLRLTGQSLEICHLRPGKDSEPVIYNDIDGMRKHLHPMRRSVQHEEKMVATPSGQGGGAHKR